MIEKVNVLRCLPHFFKKILFFFIVCSCDCAFATQEVARAIQVGEHLYSLVWNDEFEGFYLDSSKWSYRALGPRRKGVNVTENVRLDGNGNLEILTTKSGSNYNTSMISTQGKFKARYGYFEARVFLQKESGHWSSFWLQSDLIDNGPVDGPSKSGVEVDIMEYLAKDNLSMHHAVHWNGYGVHHKSVGKVSSIDSFGWHVFGLLWDESGYKFYIDGKFVWDFSSVVSNIAQYIIISLEVDEWGGDISNANLPDGLLVDYVRVYQRAN